MNIQFNGLSRRITMVPQAIGTSVGTAVMGWNRAAESLSTAGSIASVRGEVLHTETVLVRDLDSFVASEVDFKVDAIKLDVERYEVEAIRGMSRLMRDHRPSILSEVSPDAAESLFALTSSAGYDHLIINEELRQLESARGLPSAVTNYLLVPSEKKTLLAESIEKLLLEFQAI